MRRPQSLLGLLALFALPACSSMDGLLGADVNYFQDWECARQDGVCARTDTIDEITIAGLDGDPAVAGPISGYPSDGLGPAPGPAMLDGVRVAPQADPLGGLDPDGLNLTTSLGDRAWESYGTALSAEDANMSIDALLAAETGRGSGQAIFAKAASEDLWQGLGETGADQARELANPSVSGELTPPARRDAKLLPIHISPYVDAAGVFHSATIVWVEVEPSDWLVGEARR